MKMLSLEIENVRGIRKKICLAPEGKNLAVYGPNGSGKSAVVDALDFLLTGDISRLTGKGTRGITLKNHGKHIDAKLGEARVTAKVQFEGITQPVTLERCMSKAAELTVDPDVDEQAVKDALEIAGRGQHVLSRAEILKFITAEAGARADEIQAVLNLEEVEQLRKTLVTTKKEAEKTVQAEATNLSRSETAILPIIGLKDFSEEDVLKQINETRAILKGSPLTKLDHESLQEGVSPLTPEEERVGLDPEVLKRTVKAAGEIIQEKGVNIYEKEKELRETIKKLNEDKALRRDLQSKKLISLGISLIDDSGKCPLCLTPWEPQKLREFLSQREARAIEAGKTETKITKLALEIDSEINRFSEMLGKAAQSCEKLKEKELAEPLTAWNRTLQAWSKKLKNAIENYEKLEDLTEDFKTLKSPQKWKDIFQAIIQKADKIEKFTPRQKAWNTLTELKSALKRYIEDKKRHEQAQRFSGKASFLEKTYTDTKDKFLQELYDSVNKDFITYYKFLHGDDEENFSSELKPDGPHLDFKVDFYGRGAHHPRAMHSEGHQDSMGLCLYLALNKKISQGKIKLVILDDVVMSIDSDHRRNICRLLNTHFPGSQFIITTHNRTWARQLKTDAVVTDKNLIHFKGWKVETGPTYELDQDVWHKIQKKLDENDVSSAAHTLREHCELFYETVCDSLRADVQYRSDNRWDMGDYLKGAKEAYKKYLKAAKQAANSWGKREDVQKLEEIESQANEIIKRTQMEHWAINENVHYTKWKDSTKDDFLPLAEAFEDLENMFRCPACQGIIQLNMVGENPTNLKCPCGGVSWNLQAKK